MQDTPRSGAFFRPLMREEELFFLQLLPCPGESAQTSVLWTRNSFLSLSASAAEAALMAAGPLWMQIDDVDGRFLAPLLYPAPEAACRLSCNVIRIYPITWLDWIVKRWRSGIKNCSIFYYIINRSRPKLSCVK